jgi:hypothetical protein
LESEGQDGLLAGRICGWSRALGCGAWLNIRGALLGEPRVGWGRRSIDFWGSLPRELVSDEAPIVIASAAGGHDGVLEFLIQEVGVHFEADREVGPIRRLPKRTSLGALHVASEGGHAETVACLLRLGIPARLLTARCRRTVSFPLRAGEDSRRPFFGLASWEVEMSLTPLGEAVLWRILGVCWSAAVSADGGR